MKPLSKLNDAAQRRGLHPAAFVLGVALSIGLLYGRLAAIYQPSASPIALSRDAAPPTRREDAELFERALAAGLLRLGADDRIAIAPADLPLRRLYARDHPDLLTPGLHPSDELNRAWDNDLQQLHRALYFSASGRYVRRQVEAFNARQQAFIPIQREGERLVWRSAPTGIR